MDDGARWMAHMRGGDFAAAWAISDELLRARGGVCDWSLPRHEQSIWDGTPLRGRRVVVHCNHGLGDTVQFIRYVPLLDAASVKMIAQPSLIPLFDGMNASFEPLTDEGVRVRDDEVHVEVMELPFVFRTTVETIPRDVPYLLRDAPRASGGKIGVVWRGGDWDPRRDIPRELLESLPGAIPLQHIAPPLELARTMLSLDLVITIDSFPAHLAGALGVPVWTLLHSECDWRWMEARDDSPWYPTMRLFRQERAGEWRSVIARVRQFLSATFAPSPLSVFDVSSMRSSSSR